jgi:hypothetical protein
MKAVATIKLTIDLEAAADMGYEISDPKEYAVERALDWIDEMNRFNSLGECIEIELIEGEKTNAGL